MSHTESFTASQYAAILNSLPDPAFVLTETGRYAAVLGGKDKRYYHDGTSLVGKSIADVLSPAKAQWFVQKIQEALTGQQMLVLEYELSVHDVLGLPKEGPLEPVWFEGRISTLSECFDGERAVIWVACNITDNKRMQQKLQQQALHDELTGLKNRRGFMCAMEKAYQAYLLQGQQACLMSFDVDYFKAINDGLGHPAGDQALRELGAAVRQLVEPYEVFCRVGGDEFAILSDRCSEADITVLAQQVLDAGQRALKRYATGGPAPALSLGITSFMPADTSLEDIMRRADQALYMAKVQGGDQMFIARQGVAECSMA